MIDRMIHVVWVGDESKRPEACIQTWRDLNPDFEVRVWGNAEYHRLPWLNKRHMEQMWKQELCGVADLMRYEILYAFGGVAIDADSVCLRPLEGWVLEPEVFASWTNELALPGLVTNAFMGAVQESPFIGELIARLMSQKSVVDRRAWQSTGPQLVTETWRETGFPITVWPAHMFTPRHHSGWRYAGSGPVFAHQLFGSTLGTVEKVSALSETDDRTLGGLMPTLD